MFDCFCKFDGSCNNKEYEEKKQIGYRKIRFVKKSNLFCDKINLIFMQQNGAVKKSNYYIKYAY